ncbi:MAG: hypothetical protein HKO57_06160, partial [Akkermansiaceae bacterium]|nr:hypothetical protein [Akkermansiaceae bacterium]
LAYLVVSSAGAVTFTGNVSLGTQAEVDAASVYTEITGSLTITGTDIDDLGPLAGLTSVGGYISIRSNPALVSALDVFPALTTVGGGIYVYYNANLETFSGFDALLQTGDNIDFWYNDSLVTVSGFSVLHTAGWSLEFGDNPVLTALPQFEALETISSSLFILDNPSLAGITGFNALQHVDWSFQIVGNASLQDLCGFYNYFSAHNPYSGDGSFDIKDNHPSLPNPTTIQDVLDAGPCLPPPPPAMEISWSGGQVQLAWDPEPGADYTVKWSTDNQTWTSVPVGQAGTWTDPAASPSRKFYQLAR